MADKGIIFSAPMVRALLDGRKSQTRRLLHNPEYYGCPTGDCPHEKQAECDSAMNALSAKEVGYAKGDRLYVREAWTVRGRYTDVIEVGYRASDRASHTEFVEQWPVASAVPGKGKWPQWPKYSPSIHMPRWASRLWLEVTDVRVELLQSISDVDCIAEGPRVKGWAQFGTGGYGARPSSLDGMMVHTDQDHVYATPRCWYRELWQSLHTKPGERWEDNPWVVAISFDVHHGNVDGGSHG